MAKGQAKKFKRLEIQNERLALFNQEEDHYEEKKVGNEYFIKMWNGTTKKWQVSVYSNSSYNNYKAFGKAREEEEELDNRFKEQVNFERPTLESIKAKLDASE